jgi:hypothetical protein
MDHIPNWINIPNWSNLNRYERLIALFGELERIETLEEEAVENALNLMFEDFLARLRGGM